MSGLSGTNFLLGAATGVLGELQQIGKEDRYAKLMRERDASLEKMRREHAQFTSKLNSDARRSDAMFAKGFGEGQEGEFQEYMKGQRDLDKEAAEYRVDAGKTNLEAAKANLGKPKSSLNPDDQTVMGLGVITPEIQEKLGLTDEQVKLIADAKGKKKTETQEEFLTDWIKLERNKHEKQYRDDAGFDAKAALATGRQIWSEIHQAEPQSMGSVPTQSTDDIVADLVAKLQAIPEANRPTALDRIKKRYGFSDEDMESLFGEFL